MRMACYFFVLLLSLSNSACAVDGAKGLITFQVVGEDGVPIENATVFTGFFICQTVKELMEIQILMDYIPQQECHRTICFSVWKKMAITRQRVTTIF